MEEKSNELQSTSMKTWSEIVFADISGRLHKLPGKKKTTVCPNS